jgi:hypothetical protein
MKAYRKFSDELKNLDSNTANALHVVAGLGANELLEYLMEHGHADEVSKKDSEHMTPVSSSNMSHCTMLMTY